MTRKKLSMWLCIIIGASTIMSVFCGALVGYFIFDMDVMGGALCLVAFFGVSFTLWFETIKTVNKLLKAFQDSKY